MGIKLLIVIYNLHVWFFSESVKPTSTYLPFSSAESHTHASREHAQSRETLFLFQLYMSRQQREYFYIETKLVELENQNILVTEQ